jgi:hypothetical protein
MQGTELGTSLSSSPVLSQVVCRLGGPALVPVFNQTITSMLGLCPDAIATVADLAGIMATLESPVFKVMGGHDWNWCSAGWAWSIVPARGISPCACNSMCAQFYPYARIRLAPTDLLLLWCATCTEICQDSASRDASAGGGAGAPGPRSQLWCACDGQHPPPGDREPGDLPEQGEL